MPTRACSMSAPTRSARFASSFINVIFAANIAFAAYLVNSAQRPSRSHVRGLQLYRTRTVRTEDDSLKRFTKSSTVALSDAHEPRCGVESGWVVVDDFDIRITWFAAMIRLRQPSICAPPAYAHLRRLSRR